MKDKNNNRNTFINYIKHLNYNGDMIAIIIFMELIAFTLCIFLIPDSNKGVLIKIGCVMAIFIIIGELFFYAFRKKYKSYTMSISKCGHYYMNQNSTIKQVDVPECIIDVFDHDIVSALNYMVIKKHKTVYLTTHYHCLKKMIDLAESTGKMKVDYNEKDYIEKDLKKLKTALQKKCPQCKKCKDRTTCKLYKDQIVKMYNVKISPVRK